MGEQASASSSSRAAGHRVHFVVQKSMIVFSPWNAESVDVNWAVARFVSGKLGSFVTDDMIDALYCLRWSWLNSVAVYGRVSMARILL